MEVITLVSLLALPTQLLGVLKTVRVKDYEKAVCTVLLIVLMVGVLFVAANADSFKTWVLVEQFGPLGSMDGMSILLLGVIYGCAVAKAYDVQNAIDNTSTAKEPRLLAPPRNVS